METAAQICHWNKYREWNYWKILSALPLGVFSVRLSSTRGEMQCWCANDPVAGISSPKLPQDVSGSATATAKKTVRSVTPTTRWMKRRIASLLFRYYISLGSRYSSAKPHDHTSGGLWITDYPHFTVATNHGRATASSGKTQLLSEQITAHW